MVREMIGYRWNDLLWFRFGGWSVPQKIVLGLHAIRSFFTEDHWNRDKAVDVNLNRDINIGAATNSFSIEGAWDQDGKGLSIWDQWVNEERLHIIYCILPSKIF